MGDESYPTLELSRRLGRVWPNIEAARSLTNEKIAELTPLLADLDSEDTTIVVLGSLGRGEFTPHSDIDWYLVVDGIADPNHHKLFVEADKRIKKVAPKETGKEKTFATLVSSHNLIHNIGGEEDTNNNLTRRLLLLLESTPLTGHVTHERVLRSVLKRYLLEDRSFWRPNSDHIPHFLLNDFARLWRTMAVDFAYKLRSRSGESWALRNIKLRVSRKLLYIAGLLACLHSHLVFEPADREKLFGDEEYQLEIVELMYSAISDKPLDIVAWLSEDVHENLAVSQLFCAYDEFLGILLDPDQRERLNQLSETEAESDALFRNAREISHRFREAILDLFFGKEFYGLTRRYGVF